MSPSSAKSGVKLDIMNLHFVWFVGHATLLFSTAIYLFSFLLFHPSWIAYRFSLLSAIVSYSIVLFNSHKPTHSGDPFFKSLLLDENTQYWGLAVYLLFTRRVSISLLPFALYSVFHVLQYARTNLLPVLAPHKPELQDQIKTLTTTHYSQAMHLIAQLEVFGVMGRLILGLLTFRVSLFAVIFYGHFLRMRYFMSTYTRSVIQEAAVQVDKQLVPPTAHPKVPPQVTKAYLTAKNMVIKPSSTSAANSK
ncbi:hypothetical protein J3Q64DRAFT_1709490 [Phycomyces blakesleeanus]|uniref:Endoplasmic reticulum protein n=2 Tax=Phycomyces blakesleeanus TaxID=4837 RepID=A0A162ZNI2_PHYB8|nr:hypothetical protein PHYBLDRAFT_188784 [Phycomyces blakesleeanus NRRL 1555(-)]OAD68041.1 hypothetical protein PHYBLDRAFT_188784 [Phycomyces blakesleeanus NRRL 1555(-)]|eukprot:XP_018286081.1 hypothetical protein PHYBLDRAFT_188784 [Phycomyces blakesleeanus NRRL 1555(-)]